MLDVPQWAHRPCGEGGRGRARREHIGATGAKERFGLCEQQSLLSYEVTAS